MKNTYFGGETRFQRFISGRGFYVALAACLLAVGGVAAALAGQGLFKSEEPSVSEPPTSSAKPVEQVVTNQPDDRTTTTTKSTVTTTITAAQAADLYVLPFGNLVQKTYSDGKPAYSVTMGDWRVHNGTDFAGDPDQPVKALADGTVLSVEEDPMWGTVLCIDHGLEVVSRYCGVKPSVAVGDTVTVGQSIGTLTEIPCESGQTPHLHLELSVDGQLADPVAAIGLEVRYAEDTAIK